MMMEIPDLHPFRTLPKGRIAITILDTGAVLKFERDRGEGNACAILTLGTMDAHLLGAILSSVGRMAAGSNTHFQISGTVVEGAK